MRSPLVRASSLARLSLALDLPQSPWTCLSRKKSGVCPASSMAFKASGVATTSPSENFCLELDPRSHLDLGHRLRPRWHSTARLENTLAVFVHDEVRRAALRADRSLVIHVTGPEIGKPIPFDGLLDRCDFFAAECAIHGVAFPFVLPSFQAGCKWGRIRTSVGENASWTIVPLTSVSINRTGTPTVRLSSAEASRRRARGHRRRRF